MAEGQLSFDDANYEQKLRIWNFKRLLADKYDVVVTNPPYMGGSGMNGKLAKFAKDNYPDSKSDMFAMFLERGLDFIGPQGFNCMVTMQSWMFLSSYEKLRQNILTTTTISNLMHMENMVMGIAFGTAVANFCGRHIAGYKGRYNHIELSMIEKDRPKTFPPVGKRSVAVSTDDFAKIPGSPISYWVNENALIISGKSKKFEDFASTRAGMITGDNNRFIRFWHEIDSTTMGVRIRTRDDAVESKKRWFPYNKGGAFRKWYGNNEYVVHWENDGNYMRNFKDKTGKIPAHAFNLEYIFKENVTWSALSSYKFAARYTDYGFLHDASGSFADVNSNNIHYALSFLCSEVAFFYLSIINPTLNFQKGNISILPFVISLKQKEKVDFFTKNNIEMCRADWDGYETSWDFKKHPLV